MIVDTNALSAFADGSPSIRQHLAEAAGPFLPVVVIGEYRFGLLTSRNREKRTSWLEELCKHWRILTIDKATATHYSEIRQHLREAGTPIPTNDTWIAALAIQHTLPILSNDAHFDLIPQVKGAW